MYNFKKLNNVDVKIYGNKTKHIDEKDSSNIKQYSNVVIKSIFNDDNEFPHQMFIREVSSLINLDHPNIINIIDICINPKKSCLVLELGEIDLSGFICLNFQKDWYKDKIHIYSHQICCSVAYCHSQGIIHRDIKPKNFVLFRDDNIKLIDFGSSITNFPEYINENKSKLLYEKNMSSPSGTISYLCPEILIESNVWTSKKWSYSSDCWSLGCTLLELLTGKQIFESWTQIGVLGDLFELFKIKEQSSYDKNTECSYDNEIFSYDIIRDLIVYNNEKRLTSYQAMNHISINKINKQPQHITQPDSIGTHEGELSGSIDTHERRNMCYDMSDPIEFLCLRQEKILFKLDGDVNSHMRFILLEWIKDVWRKFKLSSRTLYLSFHIIDKYLSIKYNTIQRKNFLSLGCAALSIASDYIDYSPLEIVDFVYICDKAYVKSEILDMKKDVYHVLQYNLYITLSYDFVLYYIKLYDNNIDMDDILNKLIFIIISKEYCDDLYIEYPQDLILALILSIDKIEKLNYTDHHIELSHKITNIINSTKINLNGIKHSL